MEKRIMKRLLAILMVITILATDFYVLSSNLITYATQLNSQTSNSNIEFSVYFKNETQKLASVEESIKSKGLKLYAEIKVKNEGYLKEGTIIEVTNSNFNIVSSNKGIVENNKLILNQINAGETVEVEMVTEPIVSNKISSEMLAQISTIKLTGKYIYSQAQEGENVTAEKQVSVNYKPDENAQAELETNIITNRMFSLNGTNKRIVQVEIKSRLSENQYPIKETTLKLGLPKLSEKMPEEVSVLAIGEMATNGKTEISQEDYIINEDNLQITLKNEADENNQISWIKNVYDKLIVTLVYSEEVDASKVEVTTNSEIKLHNVGNTYTAKHTKGIENKEPNSVITGMTEITTEELYKGHLYASLDTAYNMTTTLIVTNPNIVDEIVVDDVADVFVTEQGELAANTKYIATEINLEKMLKILGQDGTIEFKNQEAIILIDKDTQVDENGNIVINHPKSVTKLNITTSKPVNAGVLEINHKKVITGSDYTRAQLQTVKTINTKGIITGTNSANGEKQQVVENPTEASIELKETITKAELTVVGDAKKLAIGESNSLELGVELITDGMKYDLYKDPTITITLPEDIKSATVESVNKLYDENSEFGEPIKNISSNGRVLEISLQGEQKTKPETQLYLQINLTNIILEDLTTTHTDTITMAYTNKNAIQYYNEGITKKSIQISGPGELITDFYLTSNENVAKKQAFASEEVTFESLLINDTEADMNNVRILGKLPTKGVTVESKDINTLETALKEINASNAKIYYTENAEATADINEAKNGWTTELTALSNVKLYLIELGTLSKGNIHKSTIKVQVTDTIQEGLQSYTNYEVIYDSNSGTNATKSSRNIVLMTDEVSDIEVELTAKVGGQKLDNGDVVKQGEVIKYTVAITNNSGRTLENIQLQANIPEGTVLVKPQEDYVYHTGYYKELPNEKQLTKTIPTLEIDKKYEIGYEVRVIKDTTITEISNELIVICNNKEFQSNELKNTIESSNIRVSMKRADDEEIKLVAGGHASYSIYVENLSDKPIKNLELSIISNEFCVEQITHAIDLKGNQIPEKISISEIQANETICFGIYGKVIEDIEILNIYAIVDDSKNNSYRSNLVTEKFDFIDAKITLSSDRPNKSYVEYGDTINYTIIVKNTGDIQGNITVNDVISEYLKVERVSVNGEIYLQKEDQTAEKYISIIPNNLSIKLFDVNPGDTAQIDIEAKVIYKTSEYEDKNILNKADVEIMGVYQETSNEIVHILTADVTVIVPENPVNPEDPTNPDNPKEPENPTDPKDPTNPENPTEPVEQKTISGLAWLDENRNGKRDSNETLLAGINVSIYDILTKDYLRDDNGKVIETTTNAKGEYTLNNIDKGSYIVLFEYDTEKYELTTYSAEGVDTSKVVLKKIEINGEEITIAVTDIINVQNDVFNINIGLREKLEFDLELDKYVSKIVVQTNKGTKTYDYDEKTFAKAEIHRKQIQGALVVLEYTIKLKNTGEVPGYVKNIVDYIPSGLTFSSELNTDWYISENYLYTNSLEKVELQPGQETEVKLVLTKVMTSENTGLINNRAEIYQDYNKYGITDIDSTPNNQNKEEDDFGYADVIIGISTGGNTMAYTILVIINMILIGMAINLMIKNQIIQIPTKKKGGNRYE